MEQYPIIKISGYTSELDTRGKMVPGVRPHPTDFYKEMHRIRDGHYKSVIEAMRCIENDDERKIFKASFLPSITISCTCQHRRDSKNVTSHSGLLNIDIDGKGNEHITDWGALRDDIFNKLTNVVCSFLSASGRGVTFVVRVSPENHIDTFYSIADSMQTYFGIKVDTVGRDVVRLRFISYDPELKLRYNLRDLLIVKPTLDYWQKLARERDRIIEVLPTGEADSIVNFREAIRRTETAGKLTFCEGEKHWYLLKIAGYCNATGMSQAYCEKMVFKYFRHITQITDAELTQPIKNAYGTYRSQFNCTSLPPKKYISYAHKKFLLKHVSKEILKKYNSILYGQKRIPGQTNYTIKVDSPLLVYFMWLIAPEYTWTCLEDRHDEYFTNEKCRLVVPENSVLEYVNGGQVWVSKQLEYPANW